MGRANFRRWSGEVAERSVREGAEKITPAGGGGPAGVICSDEWLGGGGPFIVSDSKWEEEIAARIRCPLTEGLRRNVTPFRYSEDKPTELICAVQ